MNERTDTILLLLALLSVYTGWARGFCNELMRLLTYLLSGVLAYALIPLIQPFVPDLNNPPAEQMIALIAGTVVVCFILRLSAKSLTDKVKASEFNDADKTGGALYGLVRGGAFILIIAVAIAVVAPHGLNNSRILNTAYAKARLFAYNVAGVEMKEYAADAAEPLPWKTNLLNFIQDSTITTAAGETSVLAYLCAYAVQTQELTAEQKISQEQCRFGLQTYLSAASREEAEGNLQNGVLERMVKIDE